jgi:GT2 family glycosyltransferase
MYERSHGGAQIITIDNASEPEHAKKIREMTERMGGVYIRNRKNNLFAKANNQGYRLASNNVVMFLNSDTMGVAGWVYSVEDDVHDGALYGVSAGTRYVAGKSIPYLEGWCMAATRNTWDKVGLWNEKLPGMYYEDNILCIEALKKKVNLLVCQWQVEHMNNYTTNRTKGTLDKVSENKAEFERMVKEWKK